MVMLTQAQRDDLQIKLDNNDIAGFYSDLDSYGDPYGRLGLGVTNNDTWQGQLANNYAESGSQDNDSDKEFGHGEADWLDLNQKLADRYLQEINDKDGETPDQQAIKEIHNEEYEALNLDPNDWFPNKMLEESSDPDALWADWMSNDNPADILEDAGDILSAGGRLLFGPLLAGEALANGGVDPDDLEFAKNFLDALANLDPDVRGDLLRDIFGNDIPNLPKDYGWAWDNPGALFNELLPESLKDLLDDWDNAKAIYDTPSDGSPLVLDLDGQGIDLSSVLGDGAVYWDIDEDGFAEKSAWISGNDGLLAIDLNSDGIINDHGELFGSKTVDGFTVLSGYDTNSDNVIDVNDAQFNDLLVWVDTNSDGYSQSGELHSLTSLGITSINVNATLVDYDIEGNRITHESTFTISGQTQTIVDAWFTYDNTNSHYQGDYTLDVRTLYLPTLRGFGDVKDLHIAMSGDETLLLMVQEIAVAPNATLFDTAFDLSGKVEAIMYRWAGVDGVDPASRGINVDARQIEFLEKYLGDEYVRAGGSNDPAFNGGNAVTNTFSTLLNTISAHVISQGDASEFFGENAFYNVTTGSVENSNIDGIHFLLPNQVLHQSTDTSNAYIISDITTSYEVSENNGGGYDEIWIAGVLASDLHFERDNFDLKINIGDETITIVNQLKSNINSDSSFDSFHVENLVLDDGIKIDLVNNLTFTGTDGDDAVWSTNGDDTLVGLAGNDTLIGSEGNDTLTGGLGVDETRGGAGDDSFIWSIGHGNDTIQETSGSDTLVLKGIAQSEVSYVRSGNNLSVNIGSETITVDNFFLTHNDYAVETVLFDDDSTFDLIDYFNTAPIAQNDELFGDQDTDITGNLLSDNGFGIDSDPDGDSLNVVAGTYTTLNGSIIISANGDFTYTPTTGYVGSDSFAYTLEDSKGKSTTGNATFTVSVPVEAGVNVINGTSGNDALNGDQSEVSDDTLIGGAGDDNLRGALGNDSYVWSIGDGNDTIDETGGIDEIVLHGVQESEIGFERYGTHHLKINVGDESVLINGQFYSERWGTSQDLFRVETLRLDDGTVIDLLGGLTFSGGAGNDSVTGTIGDDALFGLAGADTLYGGLGNDTLSGDTGDDSLRGELGNDSYVWSIGDGNDTIDETGGIDEIVLHGVQESEIGFERYGTHHLKINIGDESVLINGQFYSERWGTSQDLFRVETLRLDDGTVIDLLGGLTFSGGAGNDSVTGTIGDDALFGLAGADTLYGGLGNDTLSGDSGDDNLRGELGNDSYVWSIGDGNDTIDETGGIDEIVLHGVQESEIGFERYGTHHLKINIGDDSILINGQFYSERWGSSQDVYRVETLRLDDGTVIDLLGGLTFSGGAGNDSITGTIGDDVLNGLDGGDTLYAGAGDDVLYGGDGLDYVYGQAGADTFVFEGANAFNNVEIVGDFNLADGDKLDISDLIVGYDPLTDAISNFVQINDDGLYNSTLAVDADGGGDNFVTIASLYSVTGLTDENSLETSGNLITT